MKESLAGADKYSRDRLPVCGIAPRDVRCGYQLWTETLGDDSSRIASSMSFCLAFYSASECISNCPIPGRARPKRLKWLPLNIR